MDKKEIYEHLAKIYLDASSSKKIKKSRAYPKTFRNLFLISLIFIFALSSGLFFSFSRNRGINTEIALVLLPDASKINFHFDPARKETFSMPLNKLNVARYVSLGFSVKKADFRDTISLRVEFTNSFREKSEVYFKDIPHKWQDYKINLAQFKAISDWSEMDNLTFTVEEWNAREKHGIVYIDNVRFLK